MTDHQHQITLSPELVDQWVNTCLAKTYVEVFTEIAQWGADQELEACVKWVSEYCPHFGDCPLPEDMLRSARRPKPPSLKEQALEALEVIPKLVGFESERDTIRRALEALDD
jgi:hypothetical protein